MVTRVRFSAVGAHVLPEGGDGVGELAEPIGELPVGVALILMGVPAADVGEGGLDAEVGLHELRDLLEVVAEGRVGVDDAGGGLIVRRVGGLEHADGLEGLLPGAVENGIGAGVVHGLEGVRHGRGRGALAADGEVGEVADGDGGELALEGARNLCAEGDGAEGRGQLSVESFGLEGAVEPAILRGLDAGRAAFHVVLRVEVRAGGVGRAGGVDDGEVAPIVERLEGCHGRVEAEEAVEVQDLASAGWRWTAAWRSSSFRDRGRRC